MTQVSPTEDRFVTDVEAATPLWLSGGYLRHMRVRGGRGAAISVCRRPSAVESRTNLLRNYPTKLISRSALSERAQPFDQPGAPQGARGSPTPKQYSPHADISSRRFSSASPRR
jgi:hypothetical protein